MKQLKWVTLALAVILILIPSTIVGAQDESPITDDEVNALAEELYCPVCENVPLDVCPTKACAQWRDLIREKMELGWSEKQIKEFFAEQYGDQVLAVPPRRWFNWLIYVLPPLVVLIGMVVVARVIGKPGKISAAAPLVEQNEKPATPEEIIDEIEKDLRRKA